jgi:hypothetical protein
MWWPVSAWLWWRVVLAFPDPQSDDGKPETRADAGSGGRPAP